MRGPRACDGQREAPQPRDPACAARARRRARRERTQRCDGQDESSSHPHVANDDTWGHAARLPSRTGPEQRLRDAPTRSTGREPGGNLRSRRHGRKLSSRHRAVGEARPAGRAYSVRLRSIYTCCRASGSDAPVGRARRTGRCMSATRPLPRGPCRRGATWARVDHRASVRPRGRPRCRESRDPRSRVPRR